MNVEQHISDRPTTPAPLAAVTGATGFIGRHLVATLAEAGWRTRLLLRREPDEPQWRTVRPQVVAGSLGDEAALARLVDGADAVIHLAGLIKAARRADFFHVNCESAARLARGTVKPCSSSSWPACAACPCWVGRMPVRP